MATAERRDPVPAPPAKLTICGLRTRAVRVPMRRPLATSGGTIAHAPLVLLDLETEEGVRGRAYLFAYSDLGARALRQLLAGILEMVRGDAVAPVAIAKKLHSRFTLIGREGLPTIAISGFDVALWDALARATDLPLARLLGGELHPVPAYNSNGLGIAPPEKLADEALELLGEGFHAVKLRLGRKTLWEDVLATRAVRARIPAEALLMTDFNQALTVAEAAARGGALDREAIYWIEEPIRHDDYAGSARIARELETPIQIGENFLGTRAMAAAIAAGAADYVMPDLARIGGVTGWLRAAALADAAGIEMSSHLYAEVSAQLLAVTPTAHFLEYVDCAAPILAHSLHISDGQPRPAEGAGVGRHWNDEAGAQFALACSGRLNRALNRRFASSRPGNTRARRDGRGWAPDLAASSSSRAARHREILRAPARWRARGPGHNFRAPRPSRRRRRPPRAAPPCHHRQTCRAPPAPRGLRQWEATLPGAGRCSGASRPRPATGPRPGPLWFRASAQRSPKRRLRRRSALPGASHRSPRPGASRGTRTIGGTESGRAGALRPLPGGIE